MPRPDHPFKRRMTLAFISGLLMLIPLAIVSIYVADRFGKPWIAGALFATMFGVLVLISYMNISFKNYRCPRCGKKIGHWPKTGLGWDAPILYSCPDCKIEWDTGAKSGDDSGGG